MYKRQTKSNEIWCRKWEKYKHCKHAKNFYPVPDPALQKKILNLSRESLSTLIKITTGQNNLNYITHKIDPNISELCRFCEEENETFIHLLNECPVFNTNRLTLLKGLQVTNTTEWTPSTVVKFAKIPAIYEALKVRSTD